MTKQEIIDCITKNKSCSYVAVGEDQIPIESTRCYQFGVVEVKATADELLTLIEQEKLEEKEKILREIFENFVKDFFEWDEECFVGEFQEYIYKEYGVEL